MRTWWLRWSRPTPSPAARTRAPPATTRSRVDGGKDLIWYYDQPLAEVGRIAGLLCFYNERVDIELDGELQERPESPWSHRVTAAR